jgi:hypothetical protein
MKHRLVTLTAALALLSGAANAADLPGLKDGPATGSFSWGGAYVSAALGEGFSRVAVAEDSVYSAIGIVGRATAGYDMLLGNGFGLGVYGELGGKDIGTSGSPQQNFTYGGGFKASKSAGSWQIYTKIGYEGTHFAGVGFDTDLKGVALAPGAELAITRSLAIMIEPRITWNDPVTAGGWKVTATDLSVVGGLTWHVGN